MQRVASQERKEQLLLRSVTSGNLTERDRLLEYTTGEFYNDLSLYVTECEQRERELKKIKKPT